MQTPLAQSAAVAQAQAVGAGAAGRAAAVDVGLGAVLDAVGAGRGLAQRRPCRRRSRSRCRRAQRLAGGARAAQVPPQSTSVSVPFLTPSVQVAAAQSAACADAARRSRSATRAAAARRAARGSGAAAVDVGLVAVLHAVGAARAPRSAPPCRRRSRSRAPTAQAWPGPHGGHARRRSRCRSRSPFFTRRCSGRSRRSPPVQVAALAVADSAQCLPCPHGAQVGAAAVDVGLGAVLGQVRAAGAWQRPPVQTLPCAVGGGGARLPVRALAAQCRRSRRRSRSRPSRCSRTGWRPGHPASRRSDVLSDVMSRHRATIGASVTPIGTSIVRTAASGPGVHARVDGVALADAGRGRREPPASPRRTPGARRRPPAAPRRARAPAAGRRGRRR